MAPKNGLHWLWNNKSFSDVTLRLCFPRKQGSAASGTSKDEPDQRIYHLHAVLLVSYSEYFEARTKDLSDTADPGTLQYADGSGGSQGSTSETTRPSIVLTEHIDEEDDVEAFEDMLLFCYTGALSSSNTASKLVAILALADRYLIPKAVDQALQQLHASLTRGLTVGDACQILTRMPLSVQDNPLLLPVADAALAKLTGRSDLQPDGSGPAGACLFHLFGNAEVVCNAAVGLSPTSPGGPFNVARLFRKLPLNAVVMLLASDKLVATSENSVLVMADVWVWGCLQIVDASQLRSIAACIRFGQLTTAFLFDVVPKFPWLGVSSDELMALHRFAASPPDMQACVVYVQTLPGEPAWYSRLCRPSPAASEGGTRLHLEVTRDELCKLLATAQNGPLNKKSLVSSCPVFCGGVEFILYVLVQSSRAISLAHKVQVGAGSAFRGSRHRGVFTQGIFSTMDNGQQVTRTWRGVLNDDEAAIAFQFFASNEPWSDISTWERYLVDGVFRAECVVDPCQ